MTRQLVGVQLWICLLLTGALTPHHHVAVTGAPSGGSNEHRVFYMINGNEKGRGFFQALAQRPRPFNLLYVKMYKAASTTTGSLPRSVDVQSTALSYSCVIEIVGGCSWRGIADCSQT